MAEHDEYEAKADKRYRGEVKWLDIYGVGYIIADDDSEEYLMTPSSFTDVGFRTVREGDMVEFNAKVRSSIPRFKAVDVVPFGSKCRNCRRIGHQTNNCPERKELRIRCHWCGLTGHSTRSCDQEITGWYPSSKFNSWSVPDVGGGACSRVSSGDDDDKLVGSIICVKKREDVKKIEAVQDCFILEFNPFETDNNCCNFDVDDSNDDERKVTGSVICVRKREDLKKVEEVEDCFILEFDPTKIGKSHDDDSDESDDGKEEEEEEDDDKGCEKLQSIVCVTKKEDIKKVEEVEDCFILEFDPNEPVKFSKLSLRASKSEPETITVVEEDVSILAEKGQVACRDYPHPRHLCAKYPFKNTSHKIHCEKCYCYICDIPAPCTKWTTGSMHCDASDELSECRELRQRQKNA